MNELLDKLFSGEGKLSFLLLEAKEYAEQAKDEKLIEFIDKEINGYRDYSSLPEYRKIQAEIVGDITDNYGKLVEHEFSLNFSAFSKHFGLDFSIVHVADSILFIEGNLELSTRPKLVRKIPFEHSMLKDGFKFNNPDLNLVSASHSFGKASIQFILSKVRQELILGLQRIKKNQTKMINNTEEVVSNDDISVFVTYAWEDEPHNDRIISFVDFLRKKSYNASMDRKESQGRTATNFNQMMIGGLRNSDKVIIVLSEKYKEKADTFNGGVGFEFNIILEELKTNENKFIFVSFGDFDEIVPMGIVGRDILNLKRDQDENEFNELFAKLDSINTIAFSEVSSEKVEVKIKKIKPFKL